MPGERVTLIAVASIALAACLEEPNLPATTADEEALAARVSCDADNGGIVLPPGFCAVVVADEVGRARHLVVAQNGDVYVAIDDTVSAGGVLALRDRDRDGRADVQQYFGAQRANGLALTKEHLYVGYRDRIERYAIMPGELVPAGAAEVIVSDMPADGDHNRKNVQLDGKGGMFVNVGSASNACQEQNRVLESPGVDPCPELPVRAGVWRYDANLVGQVHTESARFATGLRNMEALRYDARRGALFGLQHGRDHLNDNWPALFTEQQGADLPSEEMIRIDAGIDNGWPYCYHDWQKDLKVLAPEYGGDGDIVGPRCADKLEPLIAFPGHWAPNDLLFYGASPSGRSRQFPARYVGGAFIAFHGGFDRAPLPNEGFNVVFVPFGAATPSGDFEVFADGFTGGGTPLPAAALHRPMGLAEGPDGSLYISDDVGGRIWRVVFTRR